MKISRKFLFSLLAASALAVGGTGIAIANAAPATDTGVTSTVDQVSTDPPEVGDTADVPGQGGAPEAGDVADAPGQVDPPEVGDRPDASGEVGDAADPADIPGQVDTPEVGDTADGSVADTN